jgi:hypothetical protein
MDVLLGSMELDPGQENNPLQQMCFMQIVYNRVI